MSIQVPNIVSGDDSTIHDEPHISGSRITVWYVHQRVEGRGLQPETVADRHSLDVADVYAALAYYHNNPEEMRAVDRTRQESAERAETLTPPE